MRNYVKIEGDDNWYLLLDETTTAFPDGATFKQRMIQHKKALAEAGTLTHRHPIMLQQRLDLINRMDFDYERQVDELGPILVRNIGLSVPLGESVIVEVYKGKDFPNG
jgi:hypothetical protein